MSNLSSAGNISVAGTMGIGGVTTLSSALNTAANIVQSGACSIQAGTLGLISNAIGASTGAVSLYPSGVTSISLGYASAPLSIVSPTTFSSLAASAFNCTTLAVSSTTSLSGVLTQLSNSMVFGSATITSNGVSGSGNILTLPGQLASQSVNTGTITATTVTCTNLTRNVNWVSYYNNSTQSINASTNVTLTFSGILKSYGTMPVSYSAGVFTNTSGTTIVVSVSWSFGYVNGAYTGSTYAGWLTLPASYSTGNVSAMAIPATTGQTIALNGSAVIVLTASETFSVTAWHNAGGALNTAATYPTQIYMVLLQ